MLVRGGSHVRVSLGKHGHMGLVMSSRRLLDYGQAGGGSWLRRQPLGVSRRLVHCPRPLPRDMAEGRWRKR